MTYRLFSTGDASALFGASRIIRASEAQALRDAGVALDAAADIRAKAQAVHEEAIGEGMRKGREQALAERDAFAAEQLAPAIAQVVTTQNELREDVGALALTALKHILGDLPEDVCISALVQKAMARLPLEAIECVSVAPALVECVSKCLPDGIGELVAGDERLKPGDCVIEASAGRVIASLDLQLERLAERWQVGDAQ